MNQNLEMFKMNKSQMNRIGGGKDFQCFYKSGNTTGELFVENCPDTFSEGTVAAWLKYELGDKYENISCLLLYTV